jgi:hypothetical protein
MRKIINDSFDIAAIENQFAQMLKESKATLEKIRTGNYNKAEVATESIEITRQIKELTNLLRDFKSGKIDAQQMNEQIKLLTMHRKKGEEEG